MLVHTETQRRTASHVITGVIIHTLSILVKLFYLKAAGELVLTDHTQHQKGSGRVMEVWASHTVYTRRPFTTVAALSSRDLPPLSSPTCSPSSCTQKAPGRQNGKVSDFMSREKRSEVQSPEFHPLLNVTLDELTEQPSCPQPQAIS